MGSRKGMRLRLQAATLAILTVLVTTCCAWGEAYAQNSERDPNQSVGLEEVQQRAPHFARFYEKIRQADLIFEGTVTAVEYKDSTPSTVPGEEANALPHTFVTFQIHETFKGANTGSITLRFMGGFQDRMPDALGENGPTFLVVPHFPIFEVGDRDILFIHKHLEFACPIVDGDEGRFRVIPMSPAGQDMMYFDSGHEVALDRKLVLQHGPFHNLPEINTWTCVSQYRDIDGDGNDDWDGVITMFSETIIPDGSEDSDGVEPAPPASPTLRHLDVETFRDYLRRRIAETSPAVPGVTVPSADIAQNFTIPIDEDSAPPQDEEYEIDPYPTKPELDALEARLLIENGGNPVLSPDAIRQLEHARKLQEKGARKPK